MEGENENIILTGDPGNKKNNLDLSKDPEFVGISPSNKKSDIDPDTIVVEPIISRNKLSSFINTFQQETGIKSNSEFQINKIINGSFDDFKEYHQETSFFANKPIMSDDALNNLYNSFRDLEAEEDKKNRLKADYILNQKQEEALKEKVDLESIKDDDITSGKTPKKFYAGGGVNANERARQYAENLKNTGSLGWVLGDGTNLDAPGLMRRKDNKLKPSVSDVRYGLEPSPYGAVGVVYWNEYNIKKTNFDLYNGSEIWQNAYKVNSSKSNSSNPEWDYSFEINGALGDAIKGLGSEFILSTSNEAANMFNKKFRHFGFKAEAKSTKASPFAAARESIVIYDQNDNVLFEQNVYGGAFAGIGKDFMIDAFGTPLDADIPNYGTIIRPEFYTKELTEFKLNMGAAASDASPITNLGYEFSNNEENKLFVLRDHFYEMTELNISHNRMIVRLAKDLGVNMNPEDMFDMNKSLAQENLYDPKKVMQFLNLIREKLNNMEDTSVEDEYSIPTIDINPMRGNLSEQMQFAFDFGVNSLDGLNLILNRNASLNDVFVDGKGNKKTKRAIIEKVLDYYAEELRNSMNTASKNTGFALRMNDNYKSIPLEGELALMSFQFLEQMGMNVQDHYPSEGITIDGRPSTYNELYNIVTDPSLNSEARLGEIDIKVGNPDDYGVLKPVIERAQALLERNETNFKGLFGYKNKFTNYLDLSYEWGENFLQGVGIELLDIGGSVKEIGNDVLRTIGVPEPFLSTPSIFSYGGLPMLSLGSVFDKRNAERLRKQYLPEWSTEIRNADDLGEFLFLANEPFASSTPYIAAFMANPKLGVAMVGLNSYGENLYDFRRQRESLVNMENAGISMTQAEVNMMDSSDWKLRALAGGNASIETALTALFTMRYFKSFDFLKRGKINPELKTQESIKKLASDFRFRFDKGFHNQLNRLWGIEGKALVYENLEENGIALWQYVFESAMGIREFDRQELANKLKNTTYTTAFSSTGMAAAVRLKGNSVLDAHVNLTIENNIGNGNYYTLVDQKINIDQALATYVKNQKEEGKTDKEIESSNFFKWATDYTAGLKTEIETIETNRADLVANLSKEDKIRFVDLLRDISEAEAVVNNDGLPQASKQAAFENIARMKGELTKIVNGVGSKGAFEFLPFDDKAKYIDAAYREVMNDDEFQVKETEMGGPLIVTDKSGNETNTEEFAQKIEDKAIELYLNDIELLKNENIENIPLDIIPAPGFGNQNPKDVYDMEIDPNFSREFDLNEQMKLGADRLLDAVSSLEATSGEVDQDTGKITIDNVDLDLKKDIESILSKISKYNELGNNELLANLPLGDKQVLIKFFETLNTTQENILTIDKGRFPIQRVNAIIDAYGIAVDISSQLSAPIDIFPSGAMNPILKMYAGDYTGFKIFNKGNVSKKNIATLDILKNLLIRDKRIAAPFINLYENILQKEAEVNLRNQGLYNELLDIYNVGRGKSTTRRSIFSFKLIPERRPVTLQDDYEMSIISGLGRIDRDAPDPNGEFNRYKRNILEELELRKKEYENSSGKDKRTYKGRYEALQAVVDKLKLVEAANYSDILPNASQHNVDVVERIRSIYAEREDAARARVRGFGQKWKNFDNYMPLFVIPNDLDASVLDEMQYEDPTANKAGRWSTAGSLQYATVPDSYIAEGMRLNLGDYMKNSFHSLKGSDLDATARQDVMTLYNLFNNPLFKKQFSNENDFNTFKSLFGDEFLKTFNGEVNKGRNPYTDYGDNNFFGKQTTFGKKFNETASTILSVGSATALASLTQPTQQYYSAIGNNMMRVNSPEARAFLQGKSGLFIFGLSQASNGTKAKSYATKFIQDLFGQGDKSNIYAKSQTSLRNAITAELPLDKTTKRDVSYYANTFGIPETTFIKFGISGSYTFDAILNRMQQNSELALEVFLARADKAAANASFEAHYLDYKIKNGSKYPGDAKGRMEWWKKENENPDIGAINYADGIIKEVMRPSNELSEAGIYKQSQSGLVKNTIRTIFPYAKFGLNAKTNFWTQYTIANDPNVPQEQREEANRKMQGLMLEVGTFQALKVTMAATLYGTLPEVLFGFSEEEIERYGGLNMMISEVMLPLSDAEFMKNFREELDKEGVTAANMESVEALNAYVKASMRGMVGDDAVMAIDDIIEFGKTYTNKVNLTPKNNNVMQAVVQDMISTFNPLPTPGAVNSGVYSLINYVSQEAGLTDEPIFLEYLSEDLFNDKLTTTQKAGAFIRENLGLFGIALDQSEKVIDALNLLEENKILKTVPPGINVTQYAGYGHELINQKLDNSIGMLAMLRVLVATGAVPTGPAAEITRYLDRMERGIERYITTAKSPVSGTPGDQPDPLMKVEMSRYWETLEEQKEKGKVPK